MVTAIALIVALAIFFGLYLTYAATAQTERRRSAAYRARIAPPREDSPGFGISKYRGFR